MFGPVRGMRPGPDACPNDHLAMVPAYNEAGAVGDVVALFTPSAPFFDVLVVDDGSTDDTADARRAAGARVLAPPVQPRHRRRRAVRLPCRQRARLRRRGAGRRRRPARPAPRRRPARRAATPTRARHGLRLTLPRRHGEGFRSSAPRRIGHPVVRLGPLAHRRPAGADPTSGFRMGSGAASSCSPATTRTTTPRSRRCCMMHVHRLRSREIPVRMRARTGGMSSITRRAPSTT